jgi:hypothetical protein
MIFQGMSMSLFQAKQLERFQAALHKTSERIALREIGKTFVLP